MAQCAVVSSALRGRLARSQQADRGAGMPIAGGYIDRLGIELGYAAEAAVPAALLPNETASGHFIRRVDPDGIARGLLQPTDSILAVNDIPIASLHPKALRDLIAAHASAPEAALLRILVFRNSGTERPSRVLCNLVLPSPPAFSAPPPNQRHEVIEAADALASARGSFTHSAQGGLAPARVYVPKAFRKPNIECATRPPPDPHATCCPGSRALDAPGWSSESALACAPVCAGTQLRQRCSASMAATGGAHCLPATQECADGIQG